jgi:hypothetical protein
MKTTTTKDKGRGARKLPKWDAAGDAIQIIQHHRAVSQMGLPTLKEDTTVPLDFFAGLKAASPHGAKGRALSLIMD